MQITSKLCAEIKMTYIKQWMKDRLRLSISPEKTKAVNLKRQYSGFLGINRKKKQTGVKVTCVW